MRDAGSTHACSLCFFHSLALVHTHSSGSYTIIDNLLNDHFWTPAVQLLPIWMAPNLVTMLGTCIMMFTTLVQLAYSPHFSEPAPTWVSKVANCEMREAKPCTSLSVCA